jgi:hypothetical protein
MTSDSRAGLVALVGLAVSLCSAPSLAQEQNQAAARSLFRDARTLMDSGQYAAACPKFEAASRLYASAGTVLSLADCYEQIGHTASAWTEFGEAASIAARSGRQDTVAEAQRRQAALEPRLTRLVVRVPGGIDGLVVKRDGAELAPAAWGTSIPVDPGAHEVSALAPGRVAWSKQVTTETPGQTTTVDVPDLGVVEAPAPSPPPVVPQESPPAVLDTPPPAPAGRTRRLVGWVIGGAGVVGIGVGGILGLVAKSKYSAAEGETGASRHSDSESAVSTGNVATVVVCAGAVVAAAGVVVWLTAPRSQAAVGTNGNTVFLRASF